MGLEPMSTRSTYGQLAVAAVAQQKPQVKGGPRQQLETGPLLSELDDGVGRIDATGLSRGNPEVGHRANEADAEKEHPARSQGRLRADGSIAVSGSSRPAAHRQTPPEVKVARGKGGDGGGSVATRQLGVRPTRQRRLDRADSSRHMDSGLLRLEVLCVHHDN
ncbi:hypothetical protein VPH35_105415 [Triticum aestivum]